MAYLVSGHGTRRSGPRVCPRAHVQSGVHNPSVSRPRALWAYTVCSNRPRGVYSFFTAQILIVLYSVVALSEGQLEQC